MSEQRCQHHRPQLTGMARKLQAQRSSMWPAALALAAHSKSDPVARSGGLPCVLADGHSDARFACVCLDDVLFASCVACTVSCVAAPRRQTVACPRVLLDAGAAQSNPSASRAVALTLSFRPGKQLSNTECQQARAPRPPVVIMIHFSLLHSVQRWFGPYRGIHPRPRA